MSREYNDKEKALLVDLRNLLARHGADLDVMPVFNGDESGAGVECLITGDGIRIEINEGLERTLSRIKPQKETPDQPSQPK